MSTKRIALLIDGSNFYHKLKDLGLQDQLKFNFKSFASFIANGGDLVDMKYYIGAVRKDGTKKVEKMHADQQRLFAHLRKNGFTYRLGYLLKTDGKYHEKGVDVQIAVDMLSHAFENSADKIVLISSDTDLIPAIKKSLKIGKQIEYIGFSHSKSVALLASCPSARLLIKSDIVGFVS